MIRHIVFFTFRPEVPVAERERFADQLRRLKETVPEVRELTVAFDVGKKGNSFELALDSSFDSMEAVEAYAVHPDHVKILDEVKRLCAATAKVDYYYA
ncbi:MAG: Dabb family protein [Nitrospinae bacterium]|nr:Dabb family protein [Nitrospinota bacterium]